ncbi:MAG: HD-GYP domain-containing protein [Betaproteobacteria bacterium]|nr:HD-GYP domain-containing protein [Betaproteobacteria bacterium]
MPTNAQYILPEQLCVGLYVHLDLNWTQHSFAFSSFKIKEQKQIDAIQKLGLQRIRYEPKRSDREPDPPAATTLTEPETEPLTAAELETLAEKKAQAAQLDNIRTQLSDVEQQFQDAAETVRRITANIQTQPKEVYKEAVALVGHMVESLLSTGDVMLHAMSDIMGEDAYYHSLNVTVLALMLGRTLQLSPQELEELGIGALFHDIGKTEIPQAILSKSGPLTRSELAHVEKHSLYGTIIGKKIGLSPAALSIITQHHEYYDGSGYPDHLTAERISPMARMVAIINTYDNLCNPPSLADAQTPSEALSNIFALKREKFDQVYLKAFIRCLGVYPPGSLVLLSNDMPGLVLSASSSRPLRPNVLVYSPDIPKEEALIINLEKEQELKINKSLRPAQLPQNVYHYLSPRKRVTYFFDPQQPGELS